MASARLQITVESAGNLNNSDGVLAGKLDPYVIVEVLGQESMKLQSQVVSNQLHPFWNFTGEIAGFMDGDVLRFTVMDKDWSPKPDAFLGKAELTAQDFYPNGFHGELTLADSKSQATLTVMVVVLGCDEALPELVEGERSSSAAILPSGVTTQGLQVYNPSVLTTNTTTSHVMTYSAPTDSVPQSHLVPQVPMKNMLVTRLQVIVESACNLYNSDGILAGKSDPYVIVEISGQESMKLQTEVVSNELNPVWNFVGEIAGFMDGNVLRFTVMDKDTFPNPDDFLGKAELTAQDFYPNGFHGELTLADSKTQATLSVTVVVIGHSEAAPELVEGEGVQMTEGYSSAAALASGIIMQGLQVYDPVVLTTDTATSHSMTYSAPQSDSAPQTYSETQTDSVPQVPMNDVVTTSIVERQSMASQSVTYDAVVVYPPVAVTAEEFAKLNGSVLSEALPVTEGTEAVGLEALGVGTKREADFNDSEAMDKTVKIKKKKSKRCC